MKLPFLLSLLQFATAAPNQLAPLYRRTAHDGSDHYIVKFRHNSPMAVVTDVIDRISLFNTHANNAHAKHVFTHALQGFAGHLDANTVRFLRMLPDVEYIEQDGKAVASGMVTTNGTTWGLGRISHRKPGHRDYTRDDTNGNGTCIYVVDTGVDDTHPEFEGRAHQIKSFIPNVTIDDSGHGTHCAGIAASKSYGVANKATVYGIKVLRGDRRGDWSDVIAGLDYALKDAPSRSCPYGVIVNLSVGGSYQQSVNDAAKKVVSSGYMMAVAAGNENDDVTKHSPASEPSVCTVGGTDEFDTKYSDSNWGKSIDIMAPGVSVLSLVPKNGTGSYSGTSMATPHVAGLAAYLAARDKKKATPDLCAQIVSMGTKGAVTGLDKSTVNLVPFNGNPLDKGV